MNKKGFTVVELIVSFSLTVVITIFLVQIVLALNNLYNNSGVKTELLTKQSLISSQINNKLNEKTITSLTSCGNYCLKFNYTDNTSDTFKIDYANNILEFGDYATNLPEDSYFKDVKVDIMYGATIQDYVNDAVLNINIPIYSDKIEDNFGVNIAYQFNSTNTNIEYVDFAGKGEYIVLNGDTEQTFNTQTAYVEHGYTIYDENGNVIEGNVVVDNPLTTTPYKAGTYKIKYSLMDSSNNIVSQTTRTVVVTPSTYKITNLVTNGSFENGLDDWNSSWSTEYYNLNSNLDYVKYGLNSVYVSNAVGFWLTQDIYNTMNTEHIYYVSLDVNVVELTGGNAGIRFKMYDSSTTATQYYSAAVRTVTDGYVKKSATFTPSYSAITLWLGGDPPNSSATKAYFDGYLLVDLTETFGAGNEPTKEWCDENIEWFDGTININY